LSVTNSSPLLPSMRGNAFAFQAKTVPVLDHFGSVMVTEPLGVGTLTLPPSTASLSEIGRSTWISSSLRVKMRCGAPQSRPGIPWTTAAHAGPALAAQTENLPVTGARWNVDVEYGAIRKRDLPLSAVDSVEEIELQAIVHVRAAHADIGALLAAEKLRQDIVGREIRETRVACVLRSAFGKIPVEALLRPLRPRRIDFAAVIAGTLVRIPQEIVGRRDLLELVLACLLPGLRSGCSFFASRR